MGTWWRRNRWALLALPFVLVLAAVAGSYRIWAMWNPLHLTDPTEAAVGQEVRLVTALEDETGPYAVDVTLSAGPVEVVTDYVDGYGERQPFPEVANTRVWRTELTVAAEPGSPLSACQARFTDGEGRETTYASGPNLGAPSLGPDPCRPPAPEGGEPWELPAPDERPATWTVPVYVRLVQDAVPQRVDVWFATPRYAALHLEEAP
ncbi:hypothetical protein [Ornithinimicrobium sp. Y1694]|uniref:hypothetical protein n=1 Tax=Ornithinimicrobium sp. Y1694 TaxID=3418590 RepID=UPI003CFB0E2E